MRAVVVPRDAQERLLAQLADLEAAPYAREAAPGSQTEAAEISSIDVPHEIHRPPAAIAEQSQVVPAPVKAAARSQRPMWRALVPVSACAAVAAIAFFGAIWLMTPRWSVDEVRVQLARVDFDLLETLRNFQGEPAVRQLPADPGWHKLEWRCRQVAKGWPDTLRSPSVRCLRVHDPQQAAARGPRVVGGGPTSTGLRSARGPIDRGCALRRLFFGPPGRGGGRQSRLDRGRRGVCLPGRGG